MSTSTSDRFENVARELFKLSDLDHSHLLQEKRFAEWHSNVLASARARAAFATLTEIHEVHLEDDSGVSDGRHTRDWASGFFVD
jgi:hypothetical protein